MYRCISAVAVLHSQGLISTGYTTAVDAFHSRLQKGEFKGEEDLHLSLEWILELDVQFNLTNILQGLQITPEQLGGVSFHSVMHHAAAVGAAVLPSSRTQDCMEKAGQYAKAKGWNELADALIEGMNNIRQLLAAAGVQPIPTNAAQFH